MPKAPAMAIDEVSVVCRGPLPPGSHLTRSDSVCKPLSATQLWIIFDLGTNDVFKSRVNVNVNGVRAQWGPLHLEERFVPRISWSTIGSYGLTRITAIRF